MRKLFIFLLCINSASMIKAEKLEKIEKGFAKNVIIMIPDGMSQGGVTLTRWLYNDGKPLNIDELATGLIRTHNSDTIIANSAPAGSAMATGHKTQDLLIGIKPKRSTLIGAIKEDENEYYYPVASLTELARSKGKSTGIVVTLEVMNATPAAFSAHATHRKNYNDIAEQQVFQNIDLVFGGGEFYLQKQNRDDKEDMIETLQEKGYQIVRTKEELNNLQSGKAWGLFTPKDMHFLIDKPDTEPNLTEMTKKALDILNQNEKGFFLMVEGSKVDWAAHDNSTIALTNSIKEFDDAVREVLAFAKADGNTLVIVASDHGNSGITIGNQKTDDNYSEMPLEEFVTVLRKITRSEEYVANAIKKNPSETKLLIETYFSFSPTEEELNQIAEIKDVRKLQVFLSRMISSRSNIGYTTRGHTGEEVALYVYANDSKNILTGVVQNTDLARYAERAMDGDLDALSKALFVPSKVFLNRGFELEKDLTNKDNPIFILKRNNKRYIFRENRNYFETEKGEKIEFSGIVIYNEEELFIPEEALEKLVL